MNRAIGWTAALMLAAGCCAACTTDQSTPCEYTDRSTATEVAAEHFAHVDDDYPGKIIDFCERGNSGTVEVFTTFEFWGTGSDERALCQRIYNAATNGTVKAAGLKHVLIREKDGNEAVTCGG